MILEGMDFEDRRGLEMSDFLSLAVVCQLDWYIREKIIQGCVEDRDLYCYFVMLSSITDIFRVPQGWWGDLHYAMKGLATLLWRCS